MEPVVFDDMDFDFGGPLFSDQEIDALLNDQENQPQPQPQPQPAVVGWLHASVNSVYFDHSNNHYLVLLNQPQLQIFASAAPAPANYPYQMPMAENNVVVVNEAAAAAVAAAAQAGNTVPRFECDQCPKVYALQSSLTRHRRVHSGRRPFQCGACEKAFARSDHLAEHLRRHAGQPRHQCRQCKERYHLKGSHRCSHHHPNYYHHHHHNLHH